MVEKLEGMKKEAVERRWVRGRRGEEEEGMKKEAVERR